MSLSNVIHISVVFSFNCLVNATSFLYEVERTPR